MKALSAVSIHQYERASRMMYSYDAIIAMGLQAVLRARRARGVPPLPPAPAPAPGGALGLVVIGSDRGRCGRLNDRVAQAAVEAAADTGECRVLVSGLRAEARLRAAGQPVERLFELPGSTAGLIPAVERLVLAIDAWMREGAVARVTLVYSRRDPPAPPKPVRVPLLPIAPERLAELAKAPWPGPSLPQFRMSEDALFSWLIREHLFVALYRAHAEALASEHAARLVAMRGAERNIEQRHESLLADFRGSRQEAITRELLDIVGAYEAAKPASGAQEEAEPAPGA